MGSQQDRSHVRPLVRVGAMVGSPVEENPIDLLFNRCYEQAGVPVHFMKFHVERAEHLGDCVRGARALGFAFMGVTVPYKRAVIPHLDEIAPDSRGIGAINVVEFVGDDRRGVGHNTDGSALATSIEQVTTIAGRRICVLGAGGAARGVGAELARRGARSIAVAARDPAEGEPVAEMIRGRGPDGFEATFVPWGEVLSVPDGTEVVVNATPVGAAPQLGELALDWASLGRAGVAVDVVTGPRQTGFLQRAHDMGLITVDGVDMLVDIVHGTLQTMGADLGRDEVDEHARALAGDPVARP